MIITAHLPSTQYNVIVHTFMLFHLVVFTDVCIKNIFEVFCFSEFRSIYSQLTFYSSYFCFPLLIARDAYLKTVSGNTKTVFLCAVVRKAAVNLLLLSAKLCTSLV